MGSLRRLKNRALAKALSRYPALSAVFVKGGGARGAEPAEAQGAPWTPVEKPLSASTVAIVTTAGVHHKGQTPFDMADPDGDPSFRVIDGRRPAESLTITHDYYDHKDADRDINIVFPIERLREMRAEGLLGRVSDVHLGFMGHIQGRHLHTLTAETAPEAARILKAASVDAVLFTPG